MNEETESVGTTLSDDQRDALQEIANIGMGQAGSSIAKIWGEFVRLSIPRIANVERQEIPAVLQQLVGEKNILAVRQAFHGQLRGEVIIVVITSYSIHYTKLYECSSHPSVLRCRLQPLK